MSDLQSQLDKMRNVVRSGQGSGRLYKDHNLCKLCGQPIMRKEIVTAIGETFHAEHFQCSKCHKAITLEKHYYSSGQYFCEACWPEHCPICAKCGKPIVGTPIVRALDKTWHEEHFRCTECGDSLPATFAVRNGLPYCQKHAKPTGVVCKRCGKPITEGKYYTSKDGARHWHDACYVCASCKMPFTDDRSHFEFEGEVYCQLHYHTMKGSICAGCGLPVIGDALECNSMVWHVNCLKCTSCGRSLKDLTFNTMDNKPFCVECSHRLHGK